MANTEEIGKHKGAVETLLHEKKELSRLLQIVNSQLQRRLNELEQEGIDTEEFINSLQQKQKTQHTRQRKTKRNHKRTNSTQRKRQKQSSNKFNSRKRKRRSESKQSANNEERLSEDFFEQ